MNTRIAEKRIHQFFVFSVVLKGLSALVQIGSGVLLLFTAQATRLVYSLVQSELIEDPTDFFATQISKVLPYFSLHGQWFAALYLIGHGLIKAFLVWGLLRDKLWAYPASLFFLGVFIVYQSIRFTYTHSLFLVVLTVFDIIVIYLVYHEYRLVKAARSAV